VTSVIAIPLCPSQKGSDGSEGIGTEGMYVIPRGLIGTELLWPDALPVANQCRNKVIGPHPFFNPQQTPEGRDVVSPRRQYPSTTKTNSTETVVTSVSGC